MQSMILKHDPNSTSIVLASNSLVTKFCFDFPFFRLSFLAKKSSRDAMLATWWLTFSTLNVMRRACATAPAELCIYASRLGHVIARKQTQDTMYC